MSEKIVLHVKEREKTGKGDARKLRASGYVPAVVYGADKEPEHVFLDRKEITRVIHHEATIIYLKSENTKTETPVIIRTYDKEPLTEDVLHVDFLRVKMDEEVTSVVPVVLVNEDVCKGVKMGGIIQHGLREMEIEALPKDLPPHIEVDIANLEIGDTIKVADLVLPEGVRTAEDPEEIIVTIVPPAIYEEEAPAEETPEVPTVAETEKKEE